MKVVLFCGGLGMRLREHSENVPKPLVPIGYRPMLWHVMKYYAHWGHKDFILCLGWKADTIKNYFLNYNECTSNDFVLAGGKVDLVRSDIQDWRITFVDSGVHANIGQRLLAVRPYLEDEDVFLANYTDGLSDLPLPLAIRQFHESQAIAQFVAVPPQQSWHAADIAEDGQVRHIQPISDAGTWMNGGFMVLRREIFDYLEPGEDLVQEPFQRLAAQQRLFAYKYNGFWSCVDTYKDMQRFDEMIARGRTPWEVWKRDDLEPADFEVPDFAPTRPR